MADIAHAIRSGCLLDIVETHRPAIYQGQRRYVVQMDGEVYVVPFRETAMHIVLITAWADRKFRKRYLG